MTESLKPSAEARADWNKDMERVKDEQQARIDATVDDWMKDEGTVENALLEAVKEVSGDMALKIVFVETKGPTDIVQQLNPADLIAMAKHLKELRGGK